MSGAGVVVRRIADPRRIAAKGDGKGGGGSQTSPHTPTEFPNTLRSRATARILEVLSEGVVSGMHTARLDGSKFWQSVYLDGTPVMDEQGAMQFNLLQGDFRYGYPSQDAIPGYPIAESTSGVGVECQPYVAVVRRLSDPAISAIRYILRIPALYMQENDGDINGYSVAYAFDLSIDGGPWVNYVTERIYGKTMSPYERAVRVQLPPATTSIQARVTRLDPPAPSGFANQLFWSSYTEIIDGQIAYDDTCVIAMTVDAEQFPNLPQRAFLLDGLLVQIPVSYEPWSHTDTGNWDGTFFTQWTNNPAWVLYNLLINERWGLGRDIDVSAIDKWSFYDAQRYNDQPLSDGKGGLEPRFTCNCVINTRQDAWQVLSAVASSMLSNIYFSNGTVFIAQDKPSPIERLFGPADVVDGLFDYTGMDYRTRYTAAAITWNDPGDSYNPAVELVQDPTLVAQQGFRETQQAAFGCTSRTQAQRFGRWLIYTSQFETEAVSFRVGLENADVQPGQIIAISDPSRVGARIAGRLLKDEGSDTVTLDQVSAVIEPGWQLAVTLGSAAQGERPTIIMLTVVALLAGNQLRVSGKTQPLPAASMWIAINTEVVNPTEWRVNQIAEAGPGIYQVMATEYHKEKFAYVETGKLLPLPPFSLFPTGPLAPPTDVTDTEYIYLDGSGTPQFGVVITWTASPDARVAWYQLEMSGPGGDYRRFTQVVGIAQEVPAMRQGQWTVTLRAFDSIGRRSQAVEYSFTPVGLSKKPKPPAALYISPQGGNLVTLIWTPTGEVDVMFYWVKWTKKIGSGASWDRATTSIARVTRNTTQVQTPMRAGTFMVKTIDSLGQESDEWAEAILSPQQTEQSTVLDEAQQPLWLGELGLWHRNRDELWLPPPDEPEPGPPEVFPGDRGVALNKTPTRVGVYSFAEGFDLGASTRVTMTGYVEGHGAKIGVVMAKWLPLASAQPLAMGNSAAMSNWRPLAAAKPLALNISAEWDAHIETRVSTDDGATWGDWFPLKSTVITAQKFEWRMVGSLYDLLTALKAHEAGVLIEVPLRSIQGNDVALDGTGHLTVTYVVPFLGMPTVQLTARQSVAPGGNIVLIESDAEHFEVEHRDAAGAPHAGGAIDYFVQGYGGHA
jgi:predicted phage tail protein